MEEEPKKKSDKSNDSKSSSKSPKPAKRKLKLISPQLLACKIEMNTVEIPPALRQRNIQLQALESNRHSNEPLKIPSPSDDGVKQRKKTATIVDYANQSTSSGNTTSDDDSGPDDSIFETYMVIEFKPDIQKNTLHWIIDKIRTKSSRGGAGLLIRREPQTNPHQGLTVHISAENCKFLQIADELEIMKPTRSGVMKNFNISCLDDFFVDEKMAINNVLTSADRQTIIKHALDSIRAKEYEKHLPGYEHVQLYHGQSLLAACIEEGLIENMYSLRDTEYLKKLKPWYTKWFSWQPLDRIRDYFGETVGIYFAFVEYHTIALIVPAVLGIFQYFLSNSYVPYFCAFYVIWMMIVQKLLGTLWPLVMPKLIQLKESYMGGLTLIAKNEYDDLNIVHLPCDDPRIEQNRQESSLLEYSSTYEDYLEMYIQFGYVVLFASISPFAAIAALINNIIELRIDAYKLCCVYKRPFAKRAKNTGAWLLAFEALLVMSIITNCALLYLQPAVRELMPNHSGEQFLLAFVIVEHALLGIAWALNKGIPDRPWWVRVALAKADYESRQAVKRESAQLTRKVLYRRFYSLHGRPRNKAE